MSANTAKVVSQESVNLQWFVENRADTDVDVEDIKRTKVVPRTNLDFSCPDDDPSEENVNNIKLFAEFIEENPQMILQVLTMF